jgi:proteasome lid subunit RPN8/RPN11
LHELLLGTGLDLIDGLRRRLAAWAAEASAMAAHLLIAVAMPKLREHSVEVEAEDVWVFLTEATAANVGVAIGCVERVPGSKMVARRILFDQERIGKGVRIDPVTPVLAFNRRAAARSTGLEESDDRHVVCVGVGALGSQVVTNMVREGFGVWTLVDSDHLLPHNLARHAAPGNAVGHGKAEVMAALLEELFASGPRPNPIQANVLDRHAAKEELMAAFAAADLIVDMSASVAVARHLARERDASARRMSLFLNPAGTDLVLLAEDAARSIPLDALEMQYYQAVASRPELLGHLAPPGGRVRYGRSCRDVSSTIPQSRVGLLAGIASAALRRAADDSAPAIAVWRIREPDLGVDVIRCESHPVLIEHHGGWVVSLDQHLLDRLWHHRLERSPDETGGVLVGSFDAQRQIVHVVETILSPADSKEWPTLYIRGAEGLAERLQQISGHTLGQLRYVGEWHSHPDGYGCEPSRDDRQVLAWLGEHMAAEGLPAVMAIVGRDKHRFLVRSIEKIDIAA